MHLILQCALCMNVSRNVPFVGRYIARRIPAALHGQCKCSAQCMARVHNPNKWF